jgi:hypothetical protein
MRSLLDSMPSKQPPSNADSENKDDLLYVMQWNLAESPVYSNEVLK